MIRIIEEKTCNGSLCFCEYIDGKKVRTIQVQGIKKLYRGKYFFLVFDSKGKLIYEAFKYLNGLNLNEDNSKEQSMIAIKLLYSYLEIFNCNIKKIGSKDIPILSQFLLGISFEGTNISLEMNTKRSNGTHNIYFSQIRGYIKFLGVENEFLFEKRNIGIMTPERGMFSHIKSKGISKFTYSKSDFSIKSKYAPKYIKKEEFKKILKNLDADRDTILGLRNKIIIELMYLRGLRIGEVLGLTLEDIKLDDNSIILRNRESDKKYQKAKGLSTVKKSNLNAYESEYSKIYVADFIKEDIERYIEISRNPFEVSEKLFFNMYQCSKADSLDGRVDNFYLFLNKNGSPLSASGWNKILKNIFIENNIKIDRNIKFINLNHRFRHGFAMYLKIEKNMDIEDVKRILRHKSISSTLVYNNPIREDIEREEIKLQNEIRKDIGIGGKRYIE